MMSSSPVAASFLASDPLRFNLNFSTPGENGPVQTLLLSAQQTSSSDEMAAESEASKESTPSITNMGCVAGESSGTPTLLPNGKKTKGRVKIKMEYIGNKLRRYTTFSKRKTGIMKKAHELSTLTGTQVMLLVASETGHVYAFATNKLKPMIASEQGKSLIQSCLNSPDEGLASLEAIKTEFTFEPPAGCGLPPSNARKRKFPEPETLSLPTMVSVPSTSPMEDYETDGESDVDDATAENCTSGFMDGGESQEDVKPVDPLQLQQTLREALKIAADQRQRQSMKRTNVKASGATRNQQGRITQGGLSSSSSAQQQLSSLLPLFGLASASPGSPGETFPATTTPTSSSDSSSLSSSSHASDSPSGTVLYHVPQGVVYAPNPEGMNVGNSNANFASSYLVNNGTSGTQSSASPEELLQQLFPGFPFNSLAVQQLLATAALSQMANGSADLKG